MEPNQRTSHGRRAGEPVAITALSQSPAHPSRPRYPLRGSSSRISSNSTPHSHQQRRVQPGPRLVRRGLVPPGASAVLLHREPPPAPARCLLPLPLSALHRHRVSSGAGQEEVHVCVSRLLSLDRLFQGAPQQQQLGSDCGWRRCVRACVHKLLLHCAQTSCAAY